MGNGKNKLYYYLNKLLGIPNDADVTYKFDPNDNTFLSTRLTDNNGNTSLFRLIVDPNAPFIEQRIYANDTRNSY